MFRIKLTEEARYGLILVLALLVLPLFMFLVSTLLEKGKKPDSNQKPKEKTVILTQAKENNAPQKPLAKSVVSSVRDAINQGNYSTAVMEIRKVSKNSPEYEELNKMITEENRKRKAPGVRKDTGTSPSAPIRYFDESTPRDRTSDAIYVYFVDISGTLLPRFCIQAAAKHPLRITGFRIAADNKNIVINAPSVKVENTGKGVAEWYDIPLDRSAYETVQAMLKAKKVVLTIIGSNGKKSRDVSDSERKGLRQILDGYAALGGNLNYLQENKPVPK